MPDLRQSPFWADLREFSERATRVLALEGKNKLTKAERRQTADDLATILVLIERLNRWIA